MSNLTLVELEFQICALERTVNFANSSTSVMFLSYISILFWKRKVMHRAENLRTSPMVGADHIVIRKIWLETFVDFRSPRSLLESMAVKLGGLGNSRVFPCSKETGLVLLVKAIVDGDVRGTGRIYYFLQVLDGLCVGE